MEESKLRYWENWIMLGGLLLFTFKYLSGINSQLNEDVNFLLLQRVPVDQVNRALEIYNPFLNLILPVTLFVISVYFAWLMIHQYVFPNLNNIGKDKTSLVAFILAVSLLIVGFSIHQSLRFYWTTNSEFNPILFIKRTRKISLVANTSVYLSLILIYEYLSMMFYQLCRRFRQEGNMYNVVINFCFAICSLLFIIILLRPNFFALSMRDLLPYLQFIIIAVCTVYGEMVFFYFIKKSKYIIGSVILVLISALGISLINIYSIGFDATYYSFWTFLGRENELYLLIFLGIIAAGAFAGTLHYLYDKQQKMLLTKVDVQSAELKQLRSQVNPHFLFNALNSMYALALKENADKTASGIQKLGDMMRFMLDQSDYITIQKEIEQLQIYIEIQQLRLDGSIDVELFLEPVSAPLEIAPMLLNPFVENAFKHGISLQSASWIRITLTHDAEHIFFKVHNSLHKDREERDTERNNHGIGLENVKRRLNLLYPNKHQLIIQESDQDFFVSLTLKVV